MEGKELLRRYQEVYNTSKRLARQDIKQFAKLVHPEHEQQWFHNRIYEYINKWIRKDVRKLAIFMPPQHGKSTMSSILNPAYILGTNPKAKVVCASYNQIVSSKFNRLTQDVMSLDIYKEVFPETILPMAGIERANELRNASYFETVGNKGFYRSVGIGGSLTGTTVEYGIIDDPIKDRVEANSETYRQRLWDWYIDVWSTRLNNESCELMLFTRWHEDDLAGRLFDQNNKHYDAERAKEWTVIILPALKENAEPPIKQAIDVGDNREEGEALWESFHGAKKHLEDKRTSPYTFASLKQQRPSPLEGGLLKRNYFEIINENQLPFNPEDEREPVPVHFIIDGAFTDKTTNDPSAVMAYYVWGGKLWIKNCISVYKEMNEFLIFVKNFMIDQGYTGLSTVRIEYKSSGPGLMSMLAQEQYGAFNVVRVASQHVAWGKQTRGDYAEPSCASEKVKIIKGGWNEAFLKEVVTFPNDLHDDMYDCLCYAVLQEIAGAGMNVYKAKVKSKGTIV